MKVRYVKIFGIPYYTKETKRFPWSKWEPVRSGEQIIPFRRVNNKKFDPEWKWTKPEGEDDGSMKVIER